MQAVFGKGHGDGFMTICWTVASLYRLCRLKASPWIRQLALVVAMGLTSLYADR